MFPVALLAVVSILHTSGINSYAFKNTKYGFKELYLFLKPLAELFGMDPEEVKSATPTAVRSFFFFELCYILTCDAAPRLSRRKGNNDRQYQLLNGSRIFLSEIPT